MITLTFLCLDLYLFTLGSPFFHFGFISFFLIGFLDEQRVFDGKLSRKLLPRTFFFLSLPPFLFFILFILMHMLLGMLNFKNFVGWNLALRFFPFYIFFFFLRRLYILLLFPYREFYIFYCLVTFFPFFSRRWPLCILFVIPWFLGHFLLRIIIYVLYNSSTTCTLLFVSTFKRPYFFFMNHLVNFLVFII